MSDAVTNSARIHDQGYRPFDGPLSSVRSRFWPIAQHELRQAWKSKWFRRLVWVSFFPLGIFAVLVIARSRMGGLIQTEQIWQQFWGIQLLFAMLAVYYVGRSAVGEDLRSGALTIYFSRPVDFRQYLLGKWLAIAMGVSLVTLGPGLVLNLFMLLADSDTGPLLFLRWFGSLLALTGLFTLAAGWLMLAISSLAGRRRAAGIVWVLIYVLSTALGAALAEATGISGLRAIGFPAASAGLADSLLGLYSFGWMNLWDLLGLLGWALVSMSIVLVRLNRWRHQ